jgi:hypothetical protein
MELNWISAERRQQYFYSGLKCFNNFMLVIARVVITLFVKDCDVALDGGFYVMAGEMKFIYA